MSKEPDCAPDTHANGPTEIGGSADEYEVERSRIADRLQPVPDDIGQSKLEAAPVAAAALFRPGSYAVAAGAVGLFVAYLLWQLTKLGGTAHTALVGDAFFFPMDMLAIYAALTASRRCRADRRRCWSWSLVSIALVGYLIGELLQFYQENIHHVADSADLSDVFFLAFFFAGIVGFGTGKRSALRRWLFTLDTLTIALSAGAILWYFVAGPLATKHGHSVSAVSYAVLYPLGNLILLLAAVWTLQRGVPPSSERAIRMIALGILFYVVADAIQSYLGLHGGYHGGDRIDILAMAAATCFVIAGAFQPMVKANELKGSTSERTGSASISYGAVVLLFALVFIIQRHDPFFPDLSILGVAVVTVILLAAAQVLSRGAFFGEQTKNKDLMDRLRYQAFHDNLTGLPNRALFHERLQHALDRRRSFSTNHAVLMIDLNKFKSINDSLGHGAGDEVLRTVAVRLRTAVRRGDTIARFGGDEFAVLFEDVNGQRATVELVQHMLRIVGEPLAIADKQLVPEASIGIALTGEEPLSADDLLRFADTAMYQAKQQPLRNFCIFDMAMKSAIADRAELQSDLEGAVGRGELRVLYQPILDLASQETVAFEALVRWMHPLKGLLAPREFLVLAEEAGLIHEIDTWVLYQACAEARRWQLISPQFAQIGVHVNLSPLQLRESDLVETVADGLSVAGLDASYLTLELLESSVVDDLELARLRLTELKALGVRIAVDDFGTGYSSLSHLRTLPIDVLKIDRSFIAAMETSAQASTLVRSLIQLGAALGIDTVAEGIEEVEQLSHLQDEECLHGQGYLFARPLDPRELRSYLAEAVGTLT